MQHEVEGFMKFHRKHKCTCNIFNLSVIHAVYDVSTLCHWRCLVKLCLPELARLLVFIIELSLQYCPVHHQYRLQACHITQFEPLCLFSLSSNITLCIFGLHKHSATLKNLCVINANITYNGP